MFANQKMKYYSFLKFIPIAFYLTPFLIGVLPNDAIAQIIPAGDGTGTLVTPEGDRIDIHGGQTSGDGSNLFHSFEEFGISEGQIANFLSTPEIENILGRVMGGNASFIDGLLQVSGGDANLFLINPAGIVFGANASLNVGGDFTATTATGIGFESGSFVAFGENSWGNLVGTPNSFEFAIANPGSIVNAGNLEVLGGNNINLIAGTIANMGELRSLDGEISIVSVPGDSIVRASLPGNVLSLEIHSPNSLGFPPTFNPLSLPELLTVGEVNTESQIAVEENGIVRLTGSGFQVEAGDIVVADSAIETGNLLLAAQENSILQESNITTTGELSLFAGETVRIRDSVARPFIAQAGGDFSIAANLGIDIFALNHPEISLSSGGDLRLASGGFISGDTHYRVGGNFSIEDAAGNPGAFFSLFDPVIYADGDVTFGTYTGPSLVVEAAGSIEAGDITVNGIDPAISAEPVLILRAGMSPSQEATAIPGTPQVEEGVEFEAAATASSNLGITTGNLTIDAEGIGGPIILQAEGDIETEAVTSNGGTVYFNSSQGGIAATGAIDTGISGGDSGAIVLQAMEDIVTDDLNASSVSGDGGDITLFSEMGAIDTSSGTVDASSMAADAGNILFYAADTSIEVPEPPPSPPIGGINDEIAFGSPSSDPEPEPEPEATPGFIVTIPFLELDNTPEPSLGFVFTTPSPEPEPEPEFIVAIPSPDLDLGFDNSPPASPRRITTGDAIATSPDGNGGSITLVAEGNIETANLNSSGMTAGEIDVTSIEGDIDTRDGTVRAASENAGGSEITLYTLGGNISTADVETNGGDITIVSREILDGTIDISGGLIDTGSEADILLDATDIVTPDNINAHGGSENIALRGFIEGGSSPPPPLEAPSFVSIAPPTISPPLDTPIETEMPVPEMLDLVSAEFSDNGNLTPSPVEMSPDSSTTSTPGLPSGNNPVAVESPVMNNPSPSTDTSISETGTSLPIAVTDEEASQNVVVLPPVSETMATPIQNPPQSNPSSVPESNSVNLPPSPSETPIADPSPATTPVTVEEPNAEIDRPDSPDWEGTSITQVSNPRQRDRLTVLALGVTNCLADTELLGKESGIPLPQSPTDYTEAIACYRQNLQFARQVGDETREGYALHNLGVAYHATGYYNRAIEFHQQRLTLAQDRADSIGQSQALSGLGAAYGTIGEYELAESYYQESLVLMGENRAEKAQILGNLGLIAHARKQFDRAIEYHQQSLDLARETGNRATESRALSNLGLAYYARTDYDRAIEYHQQSLAIAQETVDRVSTARTWDNLGLAYYAQQQFDRAVESHRQSLALAEATGDRVLEARSLSNLGDALYQAGRIRESNQMLIAAIEQWESLRKDLGNDDLSDDLSKVAIFETHDTTYSTLYENLVSQGEFDRALEIVERGRARAFVELLAGRLSPGTVPDITAPNLAQIQDVARSRNTTLVSYTVRRKIFETGGTRHLRDAELFIWVIQPTGDVDFRQVDLGSISLEDLVATSRESLGVRGVDANSASLAFAPGDRVKLHSDAPESEPWEVVAVDEENDLLSLRFPSWNEAIPPIDRPMSDVLDKVDSLRRFDPRLVQLHQLLIDPIADLLPQNPEDAIVFIPHQELFLVPFPALQDAEGTYLVKRHTMLSAPSIQALELSGRGGDGERGRWGEALIVGNPTMPNAAAIPGEVPQPLIPLPNAELEAEAIARMLGTEALIGGEATETAVIERMETAQIIHLATHGKLDDRRGIGSAIALSPGDGRDGWLSAEEIFELNLDAELVFLSACNTGQGRITGDGAIGLSRALLSAGVESAIVSLWAVPDAPTADLTIAFYQNWQESGDKATALRNAMLTMMETHPNPRDWAAFTLVGDR